MAKTAAMRLIELMVLKEDVDSVIEYLGKKKDFQFYSELTEEKALGTNASRDLFEKLQVVRSYLNIEDADGYSETSVAATSDDVKEAENLISIVNELRNREMAAYDKKKKLSDAYTEALSFSNLKIEYSELDHLSFLSLRIGKIDPAVIEDLEVALNARAMIIPLGEDKTRIMAISSKKGRFALDAELKKFGFIQIDLPKDFKGLPDDVIEGIKNQKEEADIEIEKIIKERVNFAETHVDIIKRLLQAFSIGMQVQMLRDKLESTQLVYRMTGWIPSYDTSVLMKDLDNITEGRIAIRQYSPEEVPAVKNGIEKVPVKLNHGKLVGSFERMIFSYGAPLYGTIDPTPIVAFFFTLLYGIMFGDCGQGLIIALFGVLMGLNVLKVGGWNKFYPIFISVGISSCIMGLLTGEFFGNSQILIPFGRWVTGLFGEPRNYVLHLMPSASSMDKLFMFFIFTLAVGFIINSVGLIINIINQFALHRVGRALFGKTGLSGALFFWYVVCLAVRLAAFNGSIHLYDWIVIAVTLLGVFFAHSLERLVEKKYPVFEHGIGTAIIEGLVEILEVISSYLSNSVSFLRVGAFALAHAVLGFIIFTLTSMVGNATLTGSIFVSILGNAIVIVLEGMIVAIQVIRLQYYEFFSKFFTETGKEFTPFQFKYK